MARGDGAMRPTVVGHSVLSVLERRWRGISRRLQVGFGLLGATILAAGVWLLSPSSHWPARAVLDSPGPTWPLAFSPDGATVVTAGHDGITVWNAADGRK